MSHSRKRQASRQPIVPGYERDINAETQRCNRAWQKVRQSTEDAQDAAQDANASSHDTDVQPDAERKAE